MAPRPRLIAINMQYRRPQHRWSQEERLLLCCSKRFFDLRNKDISRIFNYTYNRKIRDEGFSNGLPTSTLTTQWADMQRRSHRDWHAVHSDVSFSNGPSVFHTIVEKIRHSCRVLQISLVPRARDLIVQPPEPIHRRAPQINPRDSINTNEGPRMTHNTILHSPIIDQERDITPTPPSQISPVPEASTDPTSNDQVPTQAISRIRSFTMNNQNQPVRADQVPNILWRFSNNDSQGINHRSGFIAHAFLSDIGKIPTPEERAQEFPTWVEIHVRPRRIPSAFISTSTDPLVAIHRALTRDKNAFVTIIDSTQIKSQNIFYMKDLMRQYNIYTPGYRGAKEYVIWGTICRPAIVTSIRADELVRIADENPDIKAALQLDIISSSPNCKSQLYNRLKEKAFDSDLTVGKTVGKFLRLIRLQPDFLEDVAQSLNTSWSFTISEDTADFLRGVHHGFQTTPAPTSPNEFLETTFHSQDEIMSDNGGQQIAQNVDTQDYVIVDHPQEERNNHAFQTQVRQSMERLSINDIPSSPPLASTTATRTISIFNPGSESWVMVPETQRPTADVLESIETAQPGSMMQEEEEEEDEGADIKPSILSRTPSPVLDDPPQEQAVFRTPTRGHIRSYSESSESTIGPQTPASHRFSRERSHVNRVLNYDWPSFWDSLQNVARQ